MRAHRLLRASVRPVLGVAGLSLLLAGCSAPPSDTLLLKATPGVPGAYRVPREDDIPYAKNIIYVPDDSRFVLDLEAINTGWLHQKQISRDPTKAPSLLGGPALAGKDLWVLVNARSLSAGDTLGLQSKTISRALLVKSNLRSFGLIPLTASEKTLFALEADSDYELNFNIYEVDSAAFQRLASGYYHGNPGLSGVAIDAWGTMRSLGRAFVGESGLKAMNATRAESLPVEHLLHEAGATLQFGGQFAIYRDGTHLAPSQPDGLARVSEQHYLLVDPYQRNDTDYAHPRARGSYADGKQYLADLETTESVDSLQRGDAFVRFGVNAIWSPVRKARDEARREGEAIAAAPEIPSDVNAEERAAAFEASDRVAAAALQAYLKAAEAEKQAVLEAHQLMQRSGPDADGQPSEALQAALLAASTKTRESVEARSAWEEAKAVAAKQKQAAQVASAQRAQVEVNKESALTAGQAYEAAVREASARVGDASRAQQAMWLARQQAEEAGHLFAEKDLALATALRALEILRSAPVPDTVAVDSAEKAVAAAKEESRVASQLADQKAAEASQKASVVVGKLAEADKAEAALTAARLTKEKADTTVNQTSDQTLPLRANVLDAGGL